MLLNLKKWPESHVIWFAELVVHAIVVDDYISPVEMDYLSRIVCAIESDEEKDRLFKMVESKEKRPLAAPPGLSSELKGIIFTELAALMIADLDFDKSEQVFMVELAQTFGFSRPYTEKLMAWCMQGYTWKRVQMNLLGIQNARDYESVPFVPLDEFNADQRLWYAEVCINTIIVDGKITPDELALIRTTLGFIENNVQKDTLLHYLKNRLHPKLQAPHGISEKTLQIVYFEVITHFVLQYQGGEKDRLFTRNLARVCQFQNELILKADKWWQMGLSWRRYSLILIKNVELVAEPVT